MTPASRFLTDRMRICPRAEAVLTAILTAPLKETETCRGVLAAHRACSKLIAASSFQLLLQPANET